MIIYTYCSFKGALNGFQYLKKDKDGRDIVFPGETDKMIRDWFEKRDGWFLVLRKTEDEGGILGIASLESAIYHENELRIKRQEEIREDNKFRVQKRSINTEELQGMEIHWHINFALYDKLINIYKIAIGIFEELKKDNGLSLYKEVAECFQASEDKASYQVDTDMFRDILKRLGKNRELRVDSQEVGCRLDEREKSVPSFKEKLSALIMSKVRNNTRENMPLEFTPCIVKNHNDKKEALDLAAFAPDSFSSENMIIVMRDENLEKYERYNIALSYDWLLGR